MRLQNFGNIGNVHALRKGLLIGLVVALSLLIAGGVFAQDVVRSDVALAPSALERISWGAIIAGTLIAIVIQLAGNLLAIGLGVSRLTPEYGEDNATVGEASTTSIIVVVVTVLVSLFIGGFVAARFAGNPNNGDALLNGLMVWALDTVITLFLLTTTLGRLFSGLSSLLGTGLRAVGQATSAVAQGAATVVSGAANVAGNVVQGAANVAGNVASAAGNAAQNVAETAQDAIESNPQVQNAVQNVPSPESIIQTLQREALGLIQQAGIDPNQVRGQAEGALQGAQQTVQDAAQQVAHNPGDARQIISDAVQRLFAQGQQAAGQVGQQVNQVDRDRLIDVLAERGNISREEAEQQVVQLEQRATELRQQAEQTANRARQQAQRGAQQVQQEAQRLQAEAAQRVEQARRDAERAAREAAIATTKLVSRLALAGFAAIIVGAIAAGLGGLLGTPEAIEAVDVINERDPAIQLTLTQRAVPATSAPTLAAPTAAASTEIVVTPAATP